MAHLILKTVVGFLLHFREILDSHIVELRNEVILIILCLHRLLYSLLRLFRLINNLVDINFKILQSKYFNDKFST